MQVSTSLLEKANMSLCYRNSVSMAPVSSCPCKILWKIMHKQLLWKEIKQFIADFSLPHTMRVECIFSFLRDWARRYWMVLKKKKSKAKAISLQSQPKQSTPTAAWSYQGSPTRQHIHTHFLLPLQQTTEMLLQLLHKYSYIWRKAEWKWRNNFRHEGTSKPHSNHNRLKKSSVSHTIPAVARGKIGRWFFVGRFVS